ncbi:TPA: hypothetical protein ACNVX4_006394 [Pseudomonas aeruginosa]
MAINEGAQPREMTEAEAYATGRSATMGSELRAAQQRQPRNAILMSIKSTWTQRHRIGVRLARQILSEQVDDYRQALAETAN